MVICVYTFAVVRRISFTSGNIIQGKYASGISIKINNGQQEIIWDKQFDSNNPLTVYLSHIYEDTGLLEAVELTNICAKYPSGSFENIIKQFVLKKLRGTNRCPIKKGTKKITYPITDTFEATKEAKNCGPIIANLHIVQNKKSNSDEAPLLISGQFRGVISGDDC
ncbi:uncharacterized protein LOC127288376 isoform X2 [Leptopilina boulardi]|uniref:uncharacterized protein LOC127288376 isoform X2 n=1 Tax=Leptopilina boulardi TaxID=63433 RepID=UPI0021F5613A|nr:uncharacterized protein LOC127288376 isoform X2 [Leptopilina boulardi]